MKIIEWRVSQSKHQENRNDNYFVGYSSFPSRYNYIEYEIYNETNENKKTNKHCIIVSFEYFDYIIIRYI